MRIFCVGQGRTRVCGEAYSVYVAAGNPRRTPYNAKKTIYGWTLFNFGLNLLNVVALDRVTNFDVIVVFDTNSALITADDFFGIIFESP